MNIELNDRFLLKDRFGHFTPFIRLQDERNTCRPAVYPEGEWETEAEGIIKCGNFRIEQKEGNGCFSFRVTYTNTTVETQEIEHLIPFSGRYDKHFTHAVYSPSEPDFQPNMCSRVITARFSGGQELEGGDVCALKAENGSQLICGFLTFEKYKTALTVNENGYIELAQSVERRLLAPGESITGDWACVKPVSDAKFGLIDYAKMVGERANYAPHPMTPRGWCSWYYYYRKVTPDEILKNARFLKENLPVPGAVIQIDAGWSTLYCETGENETFTRGMKSIADEISALGFVPGIWLAPMLIPKESTVWKEHSDWLVKSRFSDEPAVYTRFGAHGGLLDVTNPEAAEYLKSEIRTLTYDWGYRYLKLDYMLVNQLEGRRHDANAGSVMAYRKALELIRGAAYPGTFILDCTAQLSASCGLVDGMRMSGDVFGHWGSLKNIMYRTLKRYYMNRTMFINDADCLIIRSETQEDEFCGKTCTRTDTEVQTYLTCMAASGGALMLSDKLELLDKKRLDLISALLPVNKTAAVPLDLWENDQPCVYDFGYRGITRIISLTNWSDYETEIELPVDKPCHLYEYWSRAYLGIRDKYTASLAPHMTGLFFETDTGYPVCIVGSECCLCPEIEQGIKDGVFTANLPKAGRYLLYQNGKVSELDAEATVRIRV